MVLGDLIFHSLSACAIASSMLLWVRMRLLCWRRDDDRDDDDDDDVRFLCSFEWVFVRIGWAIIRMKGDVGCGSMLTC